MRIYKKYGRKAELLLDRMLVNGGKINVGRGLADGLMRIEIQSMVGK
jgi:hypothetical protein